MTTITAPQKYIEEIKKSIFTATVKRVDSVEEALLFIKEVSIKNATHNCWAYSVKNEYRFSDDGEPSSTAGKPIFSAIEYSKLSNIAIVVTRESSGIKLGTGGLIRAYGGTASKVLDLCERVEIKEISKIAFSVNFDYTGKVYHIIDEFEGKKIAENFTECSIDFVIEIETSKISSFIQKIKNSTNGSAKFIDYHL